ncbi:single-stranded DNA-binding protein WHY2, mitochondrial-like [Bidens hawaiensis]|uniref:single-stranded DNA-binding protein WHY2, mitochondrial-like n=1 Tax=Bidens hawaiensis TaxID=980011 RepID=UPI0040490380
MNPRSITKLYHFMNSRNKLFKFGENAGNRFNLMSSSAAAGISTVRQSYGADGRMSSRIFADYSIFKGKAALSAAPVLPTFSKMDSGFTKIDRRGVIMLTFRPAIGERKYDSEKKQLFALSVTEVGSFISLGPGDSCEFFHDPSMQSRDAGQVRKSLSVKPHTDGYFISLSVTNNILKTNERFTVPVTIAEFAVLREAFSFALPHIMGWAHCTNPSTDGVGDFSKVRPQLAVAASEWDR